MKLSTVMVNVYRMRRVVICLAASWILLVSSASADAAGDSADIRQLVRDWVAAWQAGNFNEYAAYYLPGFSGGSGSPSRWAAMRRQRVEGRTDLSIELGPIMVKLHRDDPAIARAVFLQSYRSTSWCDVVAKSLEFRRTEWGWRISRESAEPRTRC